MEKNLLIVLNIFNHIPYLCLFIIRSFQYPEYGDGERSFYFEKYFLYLFFNNKKVDKYVEFIKRYNNILTKPYIMYYYQIFEGLFHFLIVFGGIQYLLFNTYNIFNIGILLEFYLMDILYFIIFTIINISAPKNIRFISWVSTLIHHLTIVPNLLWIIS